MGYTAYLTWHKGQEQTVATQASQDEIDGLRKENGRLSDENARLKANNTKQATLLLEALAAIEEIRNTPTLTDPQPAFPLRKQ